MTFLESPSLVNLPEHLKTRFSKLFNRVSVESKYSTIQYIIQNAVCRYYFLKNKSCSNQAIFFILFCISVLHVCYENLYLIFTFFQDFEVGRTYRKRVILTNVSYTVNYCKLVGITELLKDFIELR